MSLGQAERSAALLRPASASLRTPRAWTRSYPVALGLARSSLYTRLKAWGFVSEERVLAHSPR